MSYHPGESGEDEYDEFADFQPIVPKTQTLFEDQKDKALGMLDQGILKGKDDLDVMVEQILN